MTRKTNRPRPRVRLLPTALLPFLLLSVWCLHDSQAYVRIVDTDGYRLFWANSRATMHLNLGSYWNPAAERALAQWNAAGSRFRFDTGSRRVGPSCSRSDNINTVVWARTNCGQEFGSRVLAVTKWISRVADGSLVDSDVLFDNNKQWDIYSGPLRRNGEMDFGRVALHEFGHVLGLGHPDEHGQSVNAIMNSEASDIERLQTDDIRGIRAIYGSGSSGGGGGGDDHSNRWQEATRVGTTSDTSGRLERGGDVDYFKVTTSRSGTLTVETRGSTDTHGSLWVGRWITDDDAGSGSNFRIRHTGPARTYYIKVRGYSRSVTGSYTLRVRFTSSGGGGGDDHGNRWQEATRVGTTSDTSGRLERGGDVDYFKVTTSRSGTLTVETRGSTDTHGSLWVGRWITDDDAGSGSNFRIRHTGPARTYYIKVRGYSRSVTGSYSLRVRFTSSGGGGTLEWRITDECNDGRNIQYRFFEDASDIDRQSAAWPSWDRVYETRYYGETYTSRLDCTPGYKVCLGARSPGRNSYWGVDIDASEEGCAACCTTCPTSGTRTKGSRLTCSQ